MLITTLEKVKGTELEQELHYWLSLEHFVPKEKVDSVTSIYNKVGIADICRKKIDEYYTEGLRLLDKIQADSVRKEQLKSYVCGLVNRKL